MIFKYKGVQRYCFGFDSLSLNISEEEYDAALKLKID